MPQRDTRPDKSTREAERAEARSDHAADRDAKPDEEEAADEAKADQSDEERATVVEHERDMAERGARQKGEGRVD